MTRNQIIEQVANDIEFKKICRKICRKNGMGDELFQEVLQCLCEYEPKNLVEIYRKSNGVWFKFFVIRIAMNMNANKYSNFNKLYNNFSAINFDLPDNPAELSKEQEEILHERLQQELKYIEKKYNGEFPYEIRMLEAYLHHGTFRKLSNATGISMIACYNTIKQLREKIKKNVKLEHFID